MARHIAHINGNASNPVLAKHTRCVAHRASERAVKQGWVARATLVPEEVGHWSEGALVSAILLALFELFFNEVGDELFSLNLRKLDRTLDLLVDKKLLFHEVREGLEERV